MHSHTRRSTTYPFLMPNAGRRLMHLILFSIAGCLATMAAAAPLPTTSDAHWITTWTASPQPLWAGDFPLPTHVPFNVWNQTLRQTARISVGGRSVRIQLSNAYGTAPLVVGSAHLALAGDGADIVNGTDRPITFSGRRSVTIPPGAPALSDPIDLPVTALQRVSVSLYFPHPTAPSTFHWDGRQTAYVVTGDQTAEASIAPESTLTSRLFLSAILVNAPSTTRTVVALGDSITDGAGATMDRDTRWPDFLAARLADKHVAVLNAGISGARLLQDKMGDNALARLDRDVLSQPGIASVIVLIGINDISWNHMAFAPDDGAADAEQLIAGYRQIIARAHARNVRIVGATLTPFEGALKDTPLMGYYSADKERMRQSVNDWIRHSGEFDAVVDFDALLRDPAHPTRLLHAYDSGDHLHPGDAGNKAMAETVDLEALLRS
ncbi:lysophospholipase L1-like esterase [Rhodanobacter sp. ANJX3]|uniref:SGNH/GDSL hydrolase family protein n=1 Tax=Rhodanobacter sp. ANJX3 TaxID=2723083 RepID=UPI0017C35EE0|nr:lysophospholipase L1-like esterase [Rhodanobacter sp. ANJX3]